MGIAWAGIPPSMGIPTEGRAVVARAGRAGLNVGVGCEVGGCEVGSEFATPVLVASASLRRFPVWCFYSEHEISTEHITDTMYH